MGGFKRGNGVTVQSPFSPAAFQSIHRQWSPWERIMKQSLKFMALVASLIGVLLVIQGGAWAAEKRIALVVGNANYQTKPLETTANDAGLIAQTLQAAGFDVTGARDLDEDSLRHAFRDFVDRVSAEGPDTVAFVYFAGYGLQLEGENYLLPVGVDIRRDADIPARATRVSDYIRSLAAGGLKAGIVVLDAARADPLTLQGGAPLASGLALYEAGPHMLLAYNAAPGTIAPREPGPYGAYAHALAEMIRDGGPSVSDIFDRVRLRVDETTKGAQLPWNSPKFDSPFVFFERTAEAPAPLAQMATVRTRPIGELGPQDGYSAAVQRDTLQGYEDFIASYPRDPSAKRVRAILAIRREAITWRRARVADAPNAYWTYLRRYPHGPHVGDARRRLAQLAAAYDPPPSFEMFDYDVPPPPEEEIVYVDRPVFIFDDPDFGFAPPPPPPVYFLPPPPPDFVVLSPPVIIAESYALPVPVFVPIPVWQRAPAYVAPPPNNLIFENLHNQVILDHAANNIVIRDPAGQLLSSTALKAAAVGAAAVAIGATLPRILNNRTRPGGGPGVNPAALQQVPGAQPPLGQAPGGAYPPGQRGPMAPGAAPAANLHTPPNAQPLPTPMAPLGQGVSGKAPAGYVPPAGQGGKPAATLNAPQNGQPLAAPGMAPMGQEAPGKLRRGHAPPAGQGPNPAATLQPPTNSQPLQTPGKPVGAGPAGGAVVNHAPAGADHIAPLAGRPPADAPLHGAPGQGRALAPSLDQQPRHGGDHGHGGDRAPAMNSPNPSGGRFLDNRARDFAPAPRERMQPPPAANYHQPPSAPAVHAPPPAAAYRQPPPGMGHAPPPAYHPPAAPAAAMRAPAPAAPHGPGGPPQGAPHGSPGGKKCEIVNGAPVCK
jgi:uncharacterized caspase-like protein